MKKATVIISKIDWESLLAGVTRQINIYRDSDLHHYFGDHPEEDTIKVEIREIDGEQSKEKK